MENNAELVRLEEFVDKLLAKYNQLKTDYHALQETLRERDAECAELENNIFNLGTERTEVGNRVAGLIDRIENWENEQGAETAEGNNESHDDHGSSYSEDTEHLDI